MSPTSLEVRAFIDALPKPMRERAKTSQTAAALGKALAQARRQWPQLKPDPQLWFAQLGRALKDEPDPLSALATLQLEDLYLALACAEGDALAIGLLERTVWPEVRKSQSLQSLDAAAQDEVMQRVRARLLLPDGARPARIRSFLGQGPLAAWVSVTASRIAIDLRREARHDAADVDDDLADRLADPGDLELAYVKRRHRKDFRLAFQAAFRALAPDERNLLRFNFADGLNIEQIGVMLGIHRSTVARRIARLRHELFEGTRKRLVEQFKLTGSELNSLLMLVRSDLDVSITEVLREQASTPPGHRVETPDARRTR